MPRDSLRSVWVPQGLGELIRPVATVFRPVLLALRERKKSDEYLLGTGDKLASNHLLNHGQEFKVYPGRLRMTWPLAVCAAANADVASGVLEQLTCTRISASSVKIPSAVNRYLTTLRWSSTCSPTGRSYVPTRSVKRPRLRRNLSLKRQRQRPCWPPHV